MYLVLVLEVVILVLEVNHQQHLNSKILKASTRYSCSKVEYSTPSLPKIWPSPPKAYSLYKPLIMLLISINSLRCSIMPMVLFFKLLFPHLHAIALFIMLPLFLYHCYIFWALLYSLSCCWCGNKRHYHCLCLSVFKMFV